MGIYHGKFYKIRPVHGFTAQATTATIVLGATLSGGPVSTTQIVSSSIVGAGSAGCVLANRLTADGRETDMAARVRRFALRLEEAVGLPVVLLDERYTSQEAERAIAASQVDTRPGAGGAMAPAKRYRHYQDLLTSGDVDAVIIATPDHWHAPVTVWACQAGKDVYCEKPANHNAYEGAKMIEVARSTKRMVQIGSQSRSTPSTMTSPSTGTCGVS